MPGKHDPNSLWLAISDYGEGNLFHVYPKLLAELLLQDEAARVEGDTSEAEKLVLPSDREYRLQQYFMLVSMQKSLELDPELIEQGIIPKKARAEDQPEEWAPWSLVVHTKNPNAPPPVAINTTPGPAWDIRQVLKAAAILSKPPLETDFIDEQEMRNIYSIIYDVFRYKTILDQAISDVDFFGECPLFLKYRQIVWLFLMELARRRWAARPRGEVDLAVSLLEKAGSPFKDIENDIWKQRVHFAAAVARIRIKNKAFALSELLPPHLREERLLACVHKETVTGWVNTFKAKKVASLVKRLHELGYSYSNSRQLCAGEYRFDRVCPRFITLRPPPNDSIGQLELVKDGIIVLQEREFCEGASTFCRALQANELRGVVAQTHASSPRCSAYLAAQLRELAAVLRAKTPSAPVIPELGKLLVFGAGDRVESYVEALRRLGIDASVAPQQSDAPVRVFSEPVHCQEPTVVSALDGVVAVLATPPNSYSSVTDPIDLVCGRGGDLAMLEILTETEVDSSGKERVQSILEEQKKTLKALLSKPQIQLILYETHSALEAENQAQVTRAVAEANRMARERHHLLRRKTKEHHHVKGKDAHEAPLTESISSFENTISRTDIVKELDHDLADIFEDPFGKSDSEMPNTTVTTKIKPLSNSPMPPVLRKQDRSVMESRPATTKAKPIPNQNFMEINQIPRDPDKDNPDVVVPNCDLFEIGTLPNLGNGLDINYILDRDGCYLGLIRRKEITKLDAKYMIKVAEERGLFGATVVAAPQRRKKQEPNSSAPRRRRRKTSGFEVERVAAPTYASIVRSCRRGSVPAFLSMGEEEPLHVCEKHARRQAAASAINSNVCSCDARHRQQIRGRRSSDLARASDSPRGPPSACRRPFPLVVHELQFRIPNSHRKVVTS